MTNLRRCILCALAWAGLALALASLGCQATAEVSPLREAMVGLSNQISDIGATIGDIHAKQVDASTNNWEKWALRWQVIAPAVVALALIFAALYAFSKWITVKTGIDQHIQGIRYKRANGG